VKTFRDLKRSELLAGASESMLADQQMASVVILLALIERDLARIARALEAKKA